MFQSIFNIESDEEMLKKYEDNIESIKIQCFCDDAKIAIKGDDNFRYKLAEDYKAHRKNNQPDDEQLRRLSVVRQHALENGAIPAHGMEADDLVSHWAYEESYQDVVICHMDKDLDMIPGEHYNYHHRKMKHYTVDADEADYNFKIQLLMGDSADNIKCLHGIGPAKATAILAHTDFNNRMDMVKSLWERRVPDWQQKLLIAGNLLWLRRYAEDTFRFEHEGKLYALEDNPDES